jgi:hypothetical protein
MFIVILDSITQFKPMKGVYEVQVVKKNILDHIFKKFINIDICNNQTRHLLQNTLLIVFILITLNIGLHT